MYHLNLSFLLFPSLPAVISQAIRWSAVKMWIYSLYFSGIWLLYLNLNSHTYTLVSHFSILQADLTIFIQYASNFYKLHICFFFWTQVLSFDSLSIPQRLFMSVPFLDIMCLSGTLSTSVLHWTVQAVVVVRHGD